MLTITRSHIQIWLVDCHCWIEVLDQIQAEAARMVNVNVDVFFLLFISCGFNFL